MDDDQINDLKQFIASLISHQTSTIREEVVTDVRKEIKALDVKLTTRIDDLSLAVGEALDASNEILGKQLDDHEKRITHLEHQPA
jgi:hypothetical protein